MDFGISYGVRIVRKNGKILPLCSEFCAFLSWVIECIFWKVLKFVSFCSVFAKSLGLGHEWNWCGPNFMSFRSLKCWNFMGFMDFSVGSLLWGHELNDGAEFCAFLLLEKCKIHGKFENTCIKHNASGQFCSAPQAHWVSLNKCVIGF